MNHPDNRAGDPGGGRVQPAHHQAPDRGGGENFGGARVEGEFPIVGADGRAGHG